MFYAMDCFRNRVLIDNAEKKNKYYCPCCEQQVIVRQGKVNVWHYAHKPGSECDAAYSEKTEWHREWQNKFPEECREVVVQDLTGYRRIADVKIDGVTIEFQSKSIPKEVFDARNRHHAKASKEVIWVFDCRDKEIRGYQGMTRFEWKHPARMLAKYKYFSSRKPPAIMDKDSGNLFSGIVVFLHHNEEMIQILYVGHERDNMKWFTGKTISEDSFVETLMKKYNQPTQISMAI